MSERFAIVSTAIDPAQVEATVRDDASGAVVTFSGMVRECADDGRPVTGLAYEAHQAMAVEVFASIAGRARERFDSRLRMSIVHRIGELSIGEIAVVVSASAPHRAQAFDACRFAIDALKEEAPIWKHERYVDGSAQWKANACDERR
jgi:molybdopterin synthase catalytic subunit